jgi:hypothetical protein
VKTAVDCINQVWPDLPMRIPQFRAIKVQIEGLGIAPIKRSTGHGTRTSVLELTDDG